MNFIKGIMIGIALIIPGLSGSIFAVVVGLYDKILFYVNDLKNNFKLSVFYLTPIVLGCFVGIIFSTKIVLWICSNYTMKSYLFFIGLVIGSIPLVFKNMKLEKVSIKKMLIMICTFILILFISSLTNSVMKESAVNYIKIEEISSWKDFIVIFGSGLFSCSLMVIPGISGSVMLMIIDQYGTIYNSVGAITDMIKYIISGDFSSTINLLDTILIIIPFMLGAVIGMLLIARIIAYLLIHYKSDIYYGVLGLLIGTIITLIKSGILPYINASISFISIILSTVICICGILSTCLLSQ